MTFSMVCDAFQAFRDIDGMPLEDGCVWIGKAWQDPKENPISVYPTHSGGEPIEQPIRTRGGFLFHEGTTTNAFINEDYSIRVENRNEFVVFQSIINERTATVSYVNTAIAEGGDPRAQFGVNVKAYGAKGDGETDDYIAISTAESIAQITGSTVLFPAGIYRSSQTLLCKTIWRGAGTGSWWANNQEPVKGDERGTIIRPLGPGQPARWTDIDGNDLANFTPFIVLARSGAGLRDMRIQCIEDAEGWSAAIYVPCTRRCSLFHVDTKGRWSEAGVYLDATWSEYNQTLTTLHPEIESDGGLNEFSMVRCFIEGWWGLKLQGTTRIDPDWSEPYWWWSPGGTSDLSAFDCRLGVCHDFPLEKRQEGGGAYYNSAIIAKGGNFGQGHFFTHCTFRSGSKYLINLDKSSGDLFTTCYGETIGETALGKKGAIRVTDGTGGIVFLNNRLSGSVMLNDEVVAENFTSLYDYYKTNKITVQHADGTMIFPWVYRRSTNALQFCSRTSHGNIYFQRDPYVAGEAPITYLNIGDAGMTPGVGHDLSLGSTNYPFATAHINTLSVKAAFGPGVDDTIRIGSASYRFTTIFATTGTINTSDEREKQQIQPVDEAVMKTWGKVEYQQFKFNEAVETKGDGARIHVGLIAQRVKEIFEAEEIDPFKYGILCYDEWEDEFEPIMATRMIDIESIDYDEQGNEVKTVEQVEEEYDTGEKRLVTAAGNRYGVRYDEAMALECAYQRWRLEQIEQRLSQLTGDK